MSVSDTLAPWCDVTILIHSLRLGDGCSLVDTNVQNFPYMERGPNSSEV